MGAAAEGHWEWLQAPQQRPSLRSGALCSERTFFPHPCCPFPQPVPSQPPTACIQCLTTVHVPPVSPNFTAPLLLLRPLLFLSSLPHLSSQGEHHWTGGVCAAWAPARPMPWACPAGFDHRLLRSRHCHQLESQSVSLANHVLCIGQAPIKWGVGTRGRDFSWNRKRRKP